MNKTTKTTFVIGLAILLIGVSVGPTLGAIHNAPIPSGKECESVSSESLEASSLEAVAVPWGQWDVIPVEGCGLAGITIADITAFYDEHQDMIDALEAVYENGGIEALMESAVIQLPPQQGKGGNISLSDDLTYLIAEFSYMVDCSQDHDSDGDGIPDHDDDDADGDGIPDLEDDSGVTKIATVHPDYIGWVFLGISGTKYYFYSDNADTEDIETVWDASVAGELGLVVTYIAVQAVFGGLQLGIIPSAVLLQSVGELWAIYEIYYGVNPYDFKNVHGTGVKSTGWIDDDETVGGLTLGIIKVDIYKQPPQ